jgi:acyl carrier protein
MPESTMDKLQVIFRNVFNDPQLVIERASNAKSIPEWDSLAQISLISAIEQEFKIRFALAELARLKDVGDMIDLMEQKISRKG